MNYSNPVLSSDFHSLVVVGASGDLARKKIFPALFHLFYNDLLPKNFSVYGYARSAMTQEEFKNRISENLTCRLDNPEKCGDKMREFLERCEYISGQYNSTEDFSKLDEKLKISEGEVGNRLYYLAIPPNVFLDVARSIGKTCQQHRGWNRLILEKPFGRDLESSQELEDGLFEVFTEDNIYRIDHYLGKELIQNLMVMRFGNIIFEPLWDNKTIESVEIVWKEDIGTQGRGGYFDQYGIIRDVMQNHLMQMLSLVAMEFPVSLEAEDIRNEKVKVLKSVEAMTLEDTVLGQYEKSESGQGETYIEDPTVPDDSLSATYAAAVLKINNHRWDGVPFLLKCGKALDERLAEIRIRFKPISGNIFADRGLKVNQNELVIRVQPDEAIFFRINNKIPGLTYSLDCSDLNLKYKQRFQMDIPDAYERLILDVIRGEKSLFIRNDELREAWKIFTPALKEIDEKKIAPEKYVFGSRGPEAANELAKKHKVRWEQDC